MQCKNLHSKEIKTVGGRGSVPNPAIGRASKSIPGLLVSSSLGNTPPPPNMIPRYGPV